MTDDGQQGYSLLPVFYYNPGSSVNRHFSALFVKPCQKKQENLNHKGAMDTKEESTKGFGFSFAGQAANEKAAC